MDRQDKAQDQVIRRFDRLFALCEQEFRGITPRKPRPGGEDADPDDTEGFRQAALRSLLDRPLF